MPATGSAPNSNLVQFGGHPLHRDAAQLRRHLRQRREHPGGDGELELRDEPRRTQHPQRIVAETTPPVMTACPEPWRGSAAKPARGSRNSPGPSGVMRHRHRVDGEVAAHQIIVEPLAETHLRIARNLIVGIARKVVISKRWPSLPTPDRAEFDCRCPTTRRPTTVATVASARAARQW